MSWSLDEVVLALTAEAPEGGEEGSLSLPLFDSEAQIGIGVDGLGSCSLVLPGQQRLISFETQALKFQPWCETKWVEGNRLLPKTSVLRCRFDRSNPSLQRLVGSILLSLVDLQERFGDAGNAVLALRQLFGTGFHSTPDISVVRGLLGELVVLQATQNLDVAVSAWHVDSDSRYDFSVETKRVEVKSTTSTVREHRFTSRQLPPLRGVDVWIASVQLAEVSMGASIASLFSEYANSLPEKLAKKLSDVIVETTGLPPAALTSPMIDIESSVSSVLLFPAAVVPTPSLVSGASDLNWTAYLDDTLGQSRNLLAGILQPTESAGTDVQSSS